MADGAREFMENSAMTDEQIESGMAQMEGATPMSQAIPGLIGTFVTATIVGAITAIFRRKK